MKKIFEALGDRNGYTSFKRLTAFMAFVTAVILAFVFGDADLADKFLIYAGSMAALTIPDNMKKPEE